MKALGFGALVLLVAARAHAGPVVAAERTGQGLDRIKSLAGEWEGSARHGGGDKALPTVATIRVVSAGSAVMLVTDPGTPHEMVTMFHDDDGSLMATHYCAAMNQPRMKAIPSTDPAKVAFEFVDGTNLRQHPGRMQRLVLTFLDGERHAEEWTFQEAGKSSTMTFQLLRKR